MSWLQFFSNQRSRILIRAVCDTPPLCLIFTEQWPSHHAYTDREDIQDGAEIVKLTDNADENNIVSIISSVIKIELIDGNTTINLSDGSVQITFMMEPTEGFPPTVRQHHCYLVKREVEFYERRQIIVCFFILSIRYFLVLKSIIETKIPLKRMAVQMPSYSKND